MIFASSPIPVKHKDYYDAGYNSLQQPLESHANHLHHLKMLYLTVFIIDIKFITGHIVTYYKPMVFTYGMAIPTGT